MKKSEILVGVVVPLVTTMLGAAIGYAVNHFSQPKPAYLKLERVYLGKDSKSDFGSWKIDSSDSFASNIDDFFDFSVSGKIKQTALGDYVEGTGVRVHSRNPIIRNSIGHDLYSLSWSNSQNISDIVVTDALKAKIRESDVYCPGEGVENEISLWRSAYVSYVAQKMSLPVVQSVFRNTGEMSATIYGLKCVNVFSSGGGAGAGGESLLPANSPLEITLNYQRHQSHFFEHPIVLDAGDTTMLQFSPFVEDAAQGDGPGSLIYQVYVIFHNGQSEGEYLLGTFEQADDVDDLLVYDDEAIPILVE